MTASETARDRADAFLEFLAGVEDSGFRDFARRGRLVAGDLIETLDALDAERSCRRAMQARCDAQQALLGKRADDECVRRARP